MSTLEQLFRLEVGFHEKLRLAASGTADAASLHTSYALQSGYETLLRSLDVVTSRDVYLLRERIILAADPRDVLAASDSLKQLIGLRLVDQRGLVSAGN
jgi:hypothetical protein